MMLEGGENFSKAYAVKPVSFFVFCLKKWDIKMIGEISCKNYYLFDILMAHCK